MKKAAIVGFGGMGQRHHAAYKKNGVEVVAICDWDKNYITSRLPDFPSERIYDDYSKLIAEVDCDIVSVVSNGPTHAEITICAAEAGIKNIFCEKPIATNLRDAQAAIDVCARHGSRLAVNHIRRWNSDYHRIKGLLKADTIGVPKTFYFNCGSTGLGNFTSHFFDIVRFLTESEGAWVVGFLDAADTTNPRGAQFKDPAGYGVISFVNGTRFIVDTSEQTGVQYLFQIIGEYGRIVIDELNNSWTINARDLKGRELPLTRYGEPMPAVPFKSDSLFDIVDLTAKGQAELLDGGVISCTGEDGKKALEIVVSFHISDAGGNGKLALPLQPADFDKDVPIG